MLRWTSSSTFLSLSMVCAGGSVSDPIAHLLSTASRRAQRRLASGRPRRIRLKSSLGLRVAWHEFLQLGVGCLELLHRFRLGLRLFHHLVLFRALRCCHKSVCVSLSRSTCFSGVANRFASAAAATRRCLMRSTRRVRVTWVCEELEPSLTSLALSASLHCSGASAAEHHSLLSFVDLRRQIRGVGWLQSMKDSC